MRLIHRDWKKGVFFLLIYLVVSTPLKNTSQNGNLPQVGVKIKNIWNKHLVCTSFFRGEFRIAIDLIYTKSSVTNKFNNLWLPRRFSREFFVCKKSGCTSVVCLNVWGWNWESWPWGSFCSDLRIYMMYTKIYVMSDAMVSEYDNKIQQIQY